MKLFPTIGNQSLDSSIPYGGTQQSDDPVTPAPYYDVSLMTPDQQFQVLNQIIMAADAANPSPDTGTPPWGEPTDTGEYMSDMVQQEAYLPPFDADSLADEELLSVISDAYPADIPEWDWENDPQYFGLGVPPGVPNYGQPIESGHTQITVPNPSAELGWDAWTGKYTIARVARHENNFSRYNAGTSRGHEIPVKMLQQRGSRDFSRSNQARDLMLAEIQKRGIHNVVVTDIPAQSYTEQVVAVDPWALAPAAQIGEAGVLP